MIALNATAIDQVHEARITAALAQLQIPYDEVYVKALDLLTHGLIKLRLVSKTPQVVYRLADALHNIPRTLRVETVDQLRYHVAEAIVALEEL